MSIEMKINDLAKQIFDQNKAVGWWDDPNRPIMQTVQLVITEIAEATEAERKDLMDSHLPHRKGGEVELADALIRILDLGGRYEFTYDPEKLKEDADLFFEVMRNAVTPGDRHFAISFAVSLFGVSLMQYTKHMNDTFDREVLFQQSIIGYSAAVKLIVDTSDELGYDIESALNEKLEYNRHREDHKRKNRAMENGKKF